eukprot:4960790-Pyramimonas_sp.AAC.1
MQVTKLAMSSTAAVSTAASMLSTGPGNASGSHWVLPRPSSRILRAPLDQDTTPHAFPLCSPRLALRSRPLRPRAGNNRAAR